MLLDDPRRLHDKAAPKDDHDDGHSAPRPHRALGDDAGLHRRVVRRLLDDAAALEPEVHASRADARDERDDHALLEIEIGNRFLLLLLGKLAFLELTGKPDEHNAEKRPGDTSKNDKLASRDRTVCTVNER